MTGIPEYNPCVPPVPIALNGTVKALSIDDVAVISLIPEYVDVITAVFVTCAV